MKRFTIKANGQETKEELTGNMTEAVNTLQKQNITPIEVIDNEKQTLTLYRKGTQDKNYFVRTRDLPTPGEGDNSTPTDSNTGDNEDQVSEVPTVAKQGKNRSIKKQ
ncbi:hypothetical protein HMPREF9711_03151 [Myroides odoratimimus CCUG 3837]|uniref:hypothetical protein n=1 Tax=Myroides odoratimimus TaxID=76832 RepID=UPI000280ACF6|nr:hypothetical protein [Myroides odoratimimus]EKB02366.1 hypothetical protein HMPREF9711_03151 [Myroides odoratimimus CCUG 3837]